MKTNQKGLTLLEALVALVILALGVLGLAGVQTRVLVESRTTNSRALAIGLIDDLSNRMLLNRDSAIGKPISPGVATAVSSAYAIAWSSAPPAATATTPDPTDCRAYSSTPIVCTSAQLAASDLMSWRRAVAAVFPSGQVAVFNSVNDSRQIGVAIAWPENERQLASSTDQTLANKQFQVNVTTNTATSNGVLMNSGITCPAAVPPAPAFICHFAYVQP
jgi:type IV pilus assembly protein PilV